MVVLTAGLASCGQNMYYPPPPPNAAQSSSAVKPEVPSVTEFPEESEPDSSSASAGLPESTTPSSLAWGNAGDAESVSKKQAALSSKPTEPAKQPAQAAVQQQPQPVEEPPAPPPQPEPAPAPQGEMVWVTKTGSKYHRIPKCGNTKTSWEISLNDAVAQGYGACKKCF